MDDNAEEGISDETADDAEATTDDGVTTALDDADSGAAGGAGERMKVALEDIPEDTALRATDDVAAIELPAPPVDDNGKLAALLEESDSDDTDRPTLVPAGVSQLSRPLALGRRGFAKTPQDEPCTTAGR